MYPPTCGNDFIKNKLQPRRFLTIFATIFEKMGKRYTSRTVSGYLAGIAAGVSYGMNPLFAKTLLADGVDILTMLFFRYGISFLLMGAWMAFRGESFRIRGKEIWMLAILGVLFSCSSLFLFESYRFIPSGLATTLVYLYPVFVAIIMVILKDRPSWEVWLSIAVTFGGVILLSWPEGGVTLHWAGMMLSAMSALSYAFYLVIVNKSRTISHISEHALTFYALATGTVLFILLRISGEHGPFLQGLDSLSDVGNLVGLAIFPTMISMLTLAISTRLIGPTKTSVLGVFEPVTAILIGTVLFSEPMTPKMAAGLMVCICAVLFMVAAGKKDSR